MAAVLRIWHALVVFLQDVVHGSVLLAKRLAAGSGRLYRQVRHLTAGPAETKAPPGANGEKSGKGNEKKSAAPSSDSSTPDVDSAQAGTDEASAKPETKPETKDAKAAARAKATTRKGWTLDRCAGAAALGWIAWCFTHHPLAVGWHAVAPDLDALTPWAAAWWVAAAWLTAQYEKQQALKTPAGDAESGPAPGPDPEDVRAAGRWLWRLVCTRVADAVAKGRKGIHLNMLLEEPGIPDDWTVQTLREHCGRLGIPVKSMQIRGTGTGPTHGVHVDELTAVLNMPLDEAIRALTAHPSAAPAEGYAEAPVGLSAEGAGEAPVDPDSHPRKRRTFEEALALYSGGTPHPTGTPGNTPLPAPAPTSPGRG